MMHVMYNIYTQRIFDFNSAKNQKLIEQRGISFEDAIFELENFRELDVVDNTAKYPNQKMFVIAINNYAYAVPFIIKDNKYFLKTIYPSRQFTKKYLRKK